jgi:D-serine deaminase-like pyridoxal phosphate-dependent protein
MIAICFIDSYLYLDWGNSVKIVYATCPKWSSPGVLVQIFMSLLKTIIRPTLLLDKERCMRNIERLARKARRSEVNLRPHFKTHQSVEVGEWFRRFVIQSITVSSVDMAQYFAEAGWSDITIAFPFNLRQIQAVNDLAGRIHLGLLVESLETATFLKENLSKPVDIWINIDVGAHRTGIPMNCVAEVVALGREISTGRKLALRGVLTHAGQTYGTNPKEVTRIYADSLAGLQELKRALQKAGFVNVEISYGDTPTCSVVEDFSGVDEICPGNFVFNDSMQLSSGFCGEEDIALAVACPVVAKHLKRNQAVVYGGAAHFSKDSYPENNHRSFGYVALAENDKWGERIPGAYVSQVSQEHGLIHLDPEILEKVSIGDLLFVIPAQASLTVDLMQEYLTLDGQVIHTMGKRFKPQTTSTSPEISTL